MTPSAPAPGLRQQAGSPSDTVVVLSTAPEHPLAMRIAHCLVEESLVACAHVGQGVTAMYMWQGSLDGGTEYPLTLKTTAARLPAVYARLRELHPDDVPEFVVLGVPAGSADYLNWVAQTTAPGDSPP